MTFRTPDIGKVTPEVHEFKEKAWGTLDQQIESIGDRTDPLFQEYAHRSLNAGTKLAEAKLLLGMPGGADRILKIYEEVNGLYDKCVEIRAKLYEKYLQQNAIMDPSGTTLRQYFERTVMASPTAQTKIGRDALAAIEKIIGGLETSVADAQAGNGRAVRLGFFLQGPGGQIGIDFGKTGTARRELERIKAANLNTDGTEKFPGLSGLISRIEEQIALIEQTDPAGPGRLALRDWKQNLDRMKGPFDWRPLKLAGIVTTGLVTALGLGMSIGKSIIKKEPLKIDIATMGWGAGLLALTNPSFFRGKAENALSVVEKTNSHSLQNLRSAEKIGTGEDAFKVYEELQGLVNNRDFKFLLKQNEVNMAQLGAVTKNPIVLKTFERQFSNDTERARALRVLGTRVSRGEKEFIEHLIRYAEVKI